LQNIYSLQTFAAAMASTLDLVRRLRMNATMCFAAAMLLGAATGTHQEPHAIDTQHSVMRVRVFKAGALSAFGHDHEISAPIAMGKVDPAAQRVELEIDARTLSVVDPKASGKDRAQIRNTMLGPDVLDGERNPRIIFRSTGVEQAGSNAWKVSGNLTLHGETRPVIVQVSGTEDRYTGHSLVRQSDFGIKPVKTAGGAVRTKDEVRIEFDIQLAH
jgi:polyisoprenoid-binding protein YceI